MQLTDFQKDEIDALGDDPVKASLNMHRKKLDKFSNKALDKLDTELDTATYADTIKAYAATRGGLDKIDGRDGITLQIPLLVPPELAQHYDIEGAIAQQLETSTNENKQSNTPPSTKGDS